MDDATGWFEVIVLAAIAGFVAWRLFSVLGSRTGHETPPMERRPMADDPRDVFSGGRPSPARPVTPAEPQAFLLPENMDPALQQQLREIAAQDTSFTPDSFLNGARAAYGFILETFWQGDSASLKAFLGDDAHFAFTQAINIRLDAQKVLDSKLERITSADIIAAELIGSTAHITVRFVATIVANGISGTATDDWVFSRHTRSSDPNWLLIATDDSVGA
jgi:predicted lipid-binding transport protein (Tim44 family)